MTDLRAALESQVAKLREEAATWTKDSPVSGISRQVLTRCADALECILKEHAEPSKPATKEPSSMMDAPALGTCGECKGAGEVEIDEEMAQCEDCGGTGKRDYRKASEYWNQCYHRLKNDHVKAMNRIVRLESELGKVSPPEHAGEAESRLCRAPDKDGNKCILFPHMGGHVFTEDK